MDRTDRILEIAFGTMPPDQLVALGATMDDVAGANDLLLMDQELEQVAAAPAASMPDFIEVLLRLLRGQ